MSTEKPNSSTNPEEKNQTEHKPDREDIVDPRDLVLKGGSGVDPAELGSNPGLAPETVGLNEPAEVREGFKFD